MTAGDLVVGVGTLALAGFTAWLAWRTSHEVKVGEEQLRLTRESIEALERPFVLPESRGDRGGLISQATLSAAQALPALPISVVLTLKNYGKGPALVDRVQLTAPAGDEALENPLDGNIRAIAPDAKLKLAVPLQTSYPDVGSEVKLRVFYRSTSGGSYATVSAGTVQDKGVVQFSEHRRVDLNEIEIVD